MSKYFLLPATALLVCLALSPMSVSAEDFTIYVVDVQRVIDESIEGKAARNNMEEEVRKSEAKLSKQKSDLEKLKADFEKQSGLLSDNAKIEKKNEIDKNSRALERAVQGQREDLMSKNSSEISKVVSDVDKIIKDLGSENNRSIIIEKDPRYVIYSHERLDLTEEVIKRLDARKTSL